MRGSFYQYGISKKIRTLWPVTMRYFCILVSSEKHLQTNPLLRDLSCCISKPDLLTLGRPYIRIGLTYYGRILTMFFARPVFSENPSYQESSVSYTAEISRNQPTCFLFLVDQSGSMEDRFPSGRSKSQIVADVLNKTLFTLITRCTKSDGVRNYFDIGVIGYGGNSFYNGFSSQLGSALLHPISRIESCPVMIEERVKKLVDGAGGVIEQIIKFPVWFKPQASGATPMCQAIRTAATELVNWCDVHPNSYPPTVLHVTDGESTDGDPETLARQLGLISTNDGAVLMFNLHVSTSGAEQAKFPSSENNLLDRYARLLFRMSSQLPQHLIDYARQRGVTVNDKSRGFIYNAEPAEIVEFFDIGTRALQLQAHR